MKGELKGVIGHAMLFQSHSIAPLKAESHEGRIERRLEAPAFQALHSRESHEGRIERVPQATFAVHQGEARNLMKGELKVVNVLVRAIP